MRNVFLFFLLGISLYGYCQTEYVPYVFYSRKDVCIRTTTESKCAAKSNEKITLPIKFEEHPDWNFTVDLKAKIIDEPCEFSAADTIFAVSDIEGEFEPFRNLLITNKIIDSGYNWIFGKNHLVICGDLFDRGLHVTEYLWLLYKLEQEAATNGGYVHVILGNHDVMNLSGDFRYVQPKYLHEATLMKLDYKDMFAENTELGRWLRSKNIIEKIGNILFMHAGISPLVNQIQWNINTINTKVRPYYDKGENFPDTVGVFFDDRSPFWYRGYFVAPLATQRQVDSTCALFGVNKIVVGHTVLSKISSFFNHKVFGIDVNEHEGNYEGLLIENDEFFRVDDKGSQVLL